MLAVVQENLAFIVVTITSGILFLICLGFIFGLQKKLEQNHKNQKFLKQQLEESNAQTEILRSEIAELRSGLMSIGKRLLACENFAKDLAQQQAAQKYDDPDAKIYSRAVKMIELGADLEEIMRECEIPRAEAELLLSLHQKQS
ncbi:DUF2802 domain-containing protein [Pseudoalteromonas phenolica]|uniref:DUF2802 domain-containing protein n=1 Tax=Pseudoalteromonas phenolica TaxID=161398 RepID=A0A0S2JZV7_9GAMM|nr:hypothetical protein PP2015_962 [Pseudoalteromonas phenolica]MBE0353973.1 hypothetical protein [Pseudoalteromonas phenolica O-BC30]RXF07303.1 DUF2802 domain-containing protein [Pseudoalteromonas phenolica O-BC30]TLX45891.1 DUF2802 domain-containing protein [Pseudoalteromonas phenolica]TMO57521.1 DUF2802 domain-containing protein [Pseudoalteromonas phenolica]